MIMWLQGSHWTNETLKILIIKCELQKFVCDGLHSISHHILTWA